MNFATKNIDISIIDVFIILSDDINNINLKEICTNTKKSFLPVLNKPLLFYQLEFLERQNIKQVSLIILKNDINNVKKVVSTYAGSIKIDYIKLSEYEGIEIFSTIKKKITKTNFILIEADSILSFDLEGMIDNHIDNNNLVTMILQKKETELNKMKFLRDDAIDAFGIDYDDNNRVVYYHKKKAGDTEHLILNKKIFKRFSKFNLVMNYIDLGFYIFNSSIFDIVENLKQKVENEKKDKKKDKLTEMANNIREGFIPFLIHKTFSKDLNMILIEKYNNQLLKANRVKIGAKIIDNEKDINSEFCYKIYDYPCYLNIIEEIHKPYDEIKPIFFQTKNNIKNYFCKFSEKIRENLENKKKFNDGIPELECISADSYLVEGTNIIEKGVILNKTVANENLKVEEGSKVLSCIIGEGSVIGKNCIIKNCVLGKSCVIGDGSSIEECIIADNYKIEEKSNFSQKTLSQENENLDYN